MYGLATVITEKIGGKPWEDLITEELYQPLGMATSSFMTKVDLSGDVAVGYRGDKVDGSPIPIDFAINRYIYSSLPLFTLPKRNCASISIWRGKIAPVHTLKLQSGCT